MAVDIKKKRILSLEVTSDDGKMLKKLVDDASCRGNHIKGILADGMYDGNNNFRYLSKNHIKLGIKTKAIPKSSKLIVMLGICQY